MQIESQIANVRYAAIFQLLTAVAKDGNTLFGNKRYGNL
jgi:hypothetical protein